MSYTSTKEIKANVKTKWSHPNCKFQRGDRVQVGKWAGPTEYAGLDGKPRVNQSYNSQPIQERVGQEGHVVAVSCTTSGTIRGRSNYGYFGRQFTRYYVQFADRTILGIHSHHLDPVE